MKQKFLDLCLSLWALLFVPIMLFPILETRLLREIDRDEGINLIKGKLINEGYQLYNQIWADQPPVFSLILAGLDFLFPGSLHAPRLFTLSLTGVLCWALFELVKLVHGRLTAVATVLVLVSMSQVLRYSGAVMIGMPCLAFGTLSLLAANLAVKSERGLPGVLAGIFLALSVLTKLYGIVFALPIIYLGFFVARRSERVTYFAAIFTGGALTVSAILVLVPALITTSFSQLFSAHVLARDLKVPSGLHRVRQLIRSDRDLLPFVLLALVFILHKKDRLGAQVILLAGGALAFLALHKPVWNHHYPLLALPLAWLSARGAIAFYDFANGVLQNQVRSTIRLAMFSAIGVFLVLNLSAVTMQLRTRAGRIGHIVEPKVLRLINENLAPTDEFFTDRPIYSFLARARVGPEEAVLTAKRLRTGELLQGQILIELQRRRPKLIFLDRFPKLKVNVLHFFLKEYEIIFQQEKSVLLRLRESDTSTSRY